MSKERRIVLRTYWCEVCEERFDIDIQVNTTYCPMCGNEHIEEEEEFE